MIKNKSNQGKSSLPIIFIATFVILLISGLIYSQNKGQDTATTTTSPETELTSIPQEQTQTPTDNLTQAIDGVVTINMSAGSFYFKPNVIKVKKGDTVKVILTSDDLMHNFIIDEFKVKTPVTQAGKTTTVEFVADKAGQFEFYCGVASHQANGQVGTLIVE